jgi:hypothetical protein
VAWTANPRQQLGFPDHEIAAEFAIAIAADSLVSSAIFWVSMTSPIARFPSGPKHQLATRVPRSSSSATLACLPR